MGTPSFGFSRAQGGATGFAPAQGGSAAAWTPESLTGLVDEWDAAATYCTTDGAASLVAASTQSLDATGTPVASSGDWTICGWVYVNDVASSKQICSLWQGSNLDFQIYVSNSGPGNFYVAIRNGGSTSSAAVGSSPISASTWCFVAARHTASTKKIEAKVNGGAWVSTTYPNTADATGSNFRFGVINAATQHWDGSLQCFGAWNAALSDATVTGIYNSGTALTYGDLSAAQKTNLVSFWNMHEASGARADSHGSYDLTAVNTPGVAAGVASGTVQDRAPVKTYTGKTNSETFDQSTIANQPRWIEDGDGSGNPALDFDGTNYTSTLTTTLTQGFTLAALVRFDAAGDYLFGGDVVGEFAGRGATEWEAAFGSTINGGTPDGSWHRMIVVANGASSNIYIDGSSVASGDIGAGGVAQVILGAKGDGSAPLDGRVRAVVIADSAAGAGDVASLDAYLAAL